jgi:UTP--glucose-1-phosphate uridylyltransferase
MFKKAVIPSAGLGMRMLPITKEQPKEMMPIFAIGADRVVRVKPFLQMVFEQLYQVGIRGFCFIVGRGKRSIEDHFTSDNSLIQHLKQKNEYALVRSLTNFYGMLNKSHVIFVNQPEPRGFGNSISYARNFTGNEPFLVHAGDDLIVAKNQQSIQNLVQIFEDYSADVVFYVQRVKNPRKYGVIDGKRIGLNLYQVHRIEEKPSSPPSKLAAIAIYAFSSKIYNAIENTLPDENNEIQLTDAIQYLINDGCAVYALELQKGIKRLDIGTPESYWESLRYSRNWVFEPEFVD